MLPLEIWTVVFEALPNLLDAQSLAKTCREFNALYFSSMRKVKIYAPTPTLAAKLIASKSWIALRAANVSHCDSVVWDSIVTHMPYVESLSIRISAKSSVSAAEPLPFHSLRSLSVRRDARYVDDDTLEMGYWIGKTPNLQHLKLKVQSEEDAKKIVQGLQEPYLSLESFSLLDVELPESDFDHLVKFLSPCVQLSRFEVPTPKLTDAQIRFLGESIGSKLRILWLGQNHASDLYSHAHLFPHYEGHLPVYTGSAECRTFFPKYMPRRLLTVMKSEDLTGHNLEHADTFVSQTIPMPREYVLSCSNDYTALNHYRRLTQISLCFNGNGHSIRLPLDIAPTVTVATLYVSACLTSVRTVVPAFLNAFTAVSDFHLTVHVSQPPSADQSEEEDHDAFWKPADVHRTVTTLYLRGISSDPVHGRHIAFYMASACPSIQTLTLFSSNLCEAPWHTGLRALTVNEYSPALCQLLWLNQDTLRKLTVRKLTPTSKFYEALKTCRALTDLHIDADEFTNQDLLSFASCGRTLQMLRLEYGQHGCFESEEMLGNLVLSSLRWLRDCTTSSSSDMLHEMCESSTAMLRYGN